MPLNEIQVCIDCGKDVEPEKVICAGQKLLDIIQRLTKEQPLQDHFETRAVACLGNCDHSCRLVIASLDKWSWTIGDINPNADEAFLRQTLHQWATTPNGLIPKKERSQTLVDKALGRQPPLIVRSK